MKCKHPSRRSLLSIERLEGRLCMSAMPLDIPLTKPGEAAQAQIGQSYGQLPLSFEANQGQADAQANFLSHGNGYSLLLTPTSAALDLQQGSGVNGQGATDNVLTMQLVGANPKAQPVGLGQQVAVSNYLIGNDPSQWHTNVPNYAKASYQNVYPGVNLIYYGNNQQQLEYDFVLAPGADASAIRLSFQGTQRITLDSQGNLVLHTAGGDVVEQAPVVYQNIKGVRQAVAGKYVLESNDQVGFQVGAYDKTQPLVIDPTYSLVYSTYLGGNGGAFGRAIAVDSSGSAYVTGNAGSGFPTANPLQAHNDHGSYDVFVTKLNAAGTGVIYSTYLGGNDSDWATGIAVDAAGNVYLTGTTASTNFPTKNAVQTKLRGVEDVFVAELNVSGTALLYSTYLGGSGTDQGNGIAIDGSGKAYVTGSASSTDFPTTSSVFQSSNLSGGPEPFVTKIDPLRTGAASLVYSTYLGASLGAGNGIAVDALGNTYVTGSGLGAFVTKLNPSGSALVYSVKLGTGVGNGIAVDTTGEAYVTGRSSYQVFVMKLDTAGAGLYSIYLGGDGAFYGDSGQAIAVDRAGHAYVTGYTFSSDFPTVNAFQPTPTMGSGQNAAFVAEFDPLLSGTASIVYSSYLGGSNTITQGDGIAVDNSGNAYVTGYTYDNFPTTPGAYQTNYPGPTKHPLAEAFVTKIDPPAAATNNSTSSAPVLQQASSTGSAQNAATLLAAPAEKTVLQTTSLTRIPLGASRDQSASASASVQPSAALIATSAVDSRNGTKSKSLPTAALDEIFSRGGWFPGELALDWIR